MRCRVTTLAIALVAVVVAGCGTASGPVAPSAAADPPGPATTSGPSPSAGAPAAVAGPPVARLQGAGLAASGVAGAEGSFTWNGSGSDAPWIVQPEPVARGSGPWGVVLDPHLPVEAWTARWAPVRDGVAGDPDAAASGVGAAIVVPRPGTPGTWSLQLEASFGTGRRAAWYWTVDVVP